MKAFIAALTIVLMVLVADPKSCKSGDTPAGGDRGDSAGNSQPDGGKREQCLAPREINIDPVAYVQADGLNYTASAYLMDGECDMIDIEGENLLKVTLVAIDSRGSRMEPKLNNSPQESPFGAVVKFALPTRYSLELVAAGNMDRNQVKDSEAVFIGCALVPVGSVKPVPPVDVKLADIGGGKGKVECRIAQGL